ncbi:nitrilase [bacterium]|nr:MAG: nitrilase [bacterium]
MLDARSGTVGESVRVAVVQAAPVAFDVEATLAKTRRLAGEAAGGGARLAVFPEAFVSAYPRGMDFGAVVGSRTPEGREWFRRYWASSVDVPGPACAALGAIARECGLHLVIGVIERDGGTLYCSVLFFDPSGRLLGKHRKVMPTASERLVWGYGDGSTLAVFPTELGNLGAVICWENYMPLLRMAMYGKQVQLYCAPTADGRDTWVPTMQHIALEGRCFVLSCNQYAVRGDYPPDYPVTASDPTEVLSRGGSCIVDPYGRLLAGPDYSGETILSADVDVTQIVGAKFDFDVVGHYARPDIFHLDVDERATAAVHVQETTACDRSR